MDYITVPASRNDMRIIAKFIRYVFKVKENEKFPVITALELLPQRIKGTVYEIVNDKNLPANIPACCYPDENGNFTIEIKDSIYRGAYEKHIGAYRGHICHEICHVFLYKLGFTPIFNRQFNGNIPAYRSVEWQAKALCGEVMMPYEATSEMSEQDIINNFGVSKGFANARKRY